MATQRSIKSLFRSMYCSSGWYAAFAPDVTGMQWAIIQRTSQGPLLHAHGVDTTAQTALEHIQDVPAGFLYLASVLPSFPTLCKQVVLPPLRTAEIEAALIDTLDQTLSVGIEGNCLAYETLPTHEGSLTVIAYLARQAAVNDHLAFMQASNIDPEWIVPKAPSLAAFISHFSLGSWQYVLDIGVDEITVVLTFEGRVVENRSLVGSSRLFANLETPSAESDEQLRLTLGHLLEAVLAYKEGYGIDDTASLTITGDVLSYPLASSVVAEFVQIPLSPLHATPEGASLLQCAVAIGAAFLSHQAATSHIPNFRTGELAFPRPFLHWKRPLALLGIGCLMVASLITWYGSTRSERMVDAMRTDWKRITRINHTSPEEVNLLTEKTLPNIRPLPEASSEQMIAQGEWLLTSIERKALYPLQPNTPKVTDLVSWLSTQIDEIVRTSTEPNEKFEVQTLHYQMVKHPTKTHPKERYQVRIDLEFSTPSVAIARAFHDRLVSNTQWIDQSSEIKWTPSNGKYRASFFLKDATFYPPQEP